MQIILASAKIMNAQSNRKLPFLTHPKFEQQAQRFALELGEYDIEELSKILKCNLSIARENKLRYMDFFNEENKLPAIFAYYGQVYKCLKASELSEESLSYANKHLWLLSFLYGMLRPSDSIHPYRLEGKMKLKENGRKTMFAHWKPLLTNLLIDSVKADGGTLLHLATEEFEHLFDWQRVKNALKIIQPQFLVNDGCKLKNITVYAKSCRGAMTRYAIEQRISNVLELQQFEYEGFRFKKADFEVDNYQPGIHRMLWTLDT